MSVILSKNGVFESHSLRQDHLLRRRRLTSQDAITLLFFSKNMGFMRPHDRSGALTFTVASAVQRGDKWGTEAGL
jgi:hypothetical protein